MYIGLVGDIGTHGANGNMGALCPMGTIGPNRTKITNRTNSTITLGPIIKTNTSCARAWALTQTKNQIMSICEVTHIMSVGLSPCQR